MTQRDERLFRALGGDLPSSQLARPATEQVFECSSDQPVAEIEVESGLSVLAIGSDYLRTWAWEHRDDPRHHGPGRRYSSDFMAGVYHAARLLKREGVVLAHRPDRED